MPALVVLHSFGERQTGWIRRKKGLRAGRAGQGRAGQGREDRCDTEKGRCAKLREIAPPRLAFPAPASPGGLEQGGGVY